MPGGITLKESAPADIPTPSVGKDTIFIDSGTLEPSYKDNAGVVHTLVGPTGITGSAGPIGVPGFGVDGDDGDFIIALPGPQGNTGASGATGAAGPNGPPGMEGEGGGGSDDGLVNFPHNPDNLTNYIINPVYQRFAYIQPLATTAVGVGVGSGTVVNGAVIADAFGAWVRLSSALNGTVCSWGFQSTFGWPDLNFVFTAKVRTGADITSIRIFVGTKTNAFSNVDTLSTDGICFRYSTVAGDGGWVGVCKNAGGQTVTGTIAAIAVDTTYILRIRVSGNGTSVAFSVDNGPEVITAGNIPTGSALGGQIASIPQVAALRQFYSGVLSMVEGPNVI